VQRSRGLTVWASNIKIQPASQVCDLCIRLLLAADLECGQSDGRATKANQRFLAGEDMLQLRKTQRT